VAGDQMLTASSDQNLVAVHALQQANGNLAVLLINKDAHASYTVTLSVSGYTPTPHPTLYSYGMDSAAIHARREMGLTSTVTIPPYALLTLVYQPLLALTLHVPARSRFSQGPLLVPIHTAPHARVTITLQVRSSRPLVLYQLRLDGSTDAQGRFTGLLHGHYAPAKPAQARLTVTAQTPTATITRTTEVTLLH